MSTSALVEQLAITRKNLVESVSALDDEQLLRIPKGFSNHILWNLGHLAVTQQLLLYGLAKLPMYVSEPMIGDFRKGSSPRQWKTTYSRAEIEHLLLELPKKLGEDIEKGIFGAREPYMTSANVALNTFEEALTYNHFHEGLHLGSILALKKLV